MTGTLELAKELSLPYTPILNMVQVKEQDGKIRYSREEKEIILPKSDDLDESLTNLMIGAIAYENEWDIDNMPSAIFGMAKNFGYLLKKEFYSEQKEVFKLSFDEKGKFVIPLRMVDMVGDRKIQFIVSPEWVEIRTDKAILLKDGATPVTRVISKDSVATFSKNGYVAKISSELGKEYLQGEYQVVFIP